MRSSARLAATNRGRPANDPAKSTTPQRPRSEKGAKLHELICSLDREWGLCLDTSGQPRSPEMRAGNLAARVTKKIETLYWMEEPLLIEKLDAFRLQANKAHSKLQLLDALLPPRGTPRSHRISPRTPGGAGRSPSSLRIQTSITDRLIKSSKTNGEVGLDEAALDPGSPTDEEDFTTPPSPTPSRRVQRSPHSISRPALQRMAQKRPSPSSKEDVDSPNFSMAEKGKRPVKDGSPSRPKVARTTPPDNPFVKPTLDMARSFQTTSGRDSMATSFNTIWSSQQSTQVDTAATSFNFDGGEPVTDNPRTIQSNDATIGSLDDGETVTHQTRLTRSSSTTIGSLDDHDMREIMSKLAQEQSRRSGDSTGQSSSTYGSVDEVAMMDVALQHRQTTAIASSNHVPAATKFENRRPDCTMPTSSLHSNGNVPAPPHQNVSPNARAEASSPPNPRTDSPSKMSHHIRDIPKQNLFMDTKFRSTRIPYFVLFILCRIANQQKVSLGEMARGITEAACGDHDALQRYLADHPTCPVQQLGEAKKIWSSVDRDLDGFTFKARVSFNRQSDKPVFKLELLPIQADKSCRFQRAFGADRFLYLDFAAFDTKSCSRFTRADMDNIYERWIEWFCTEHSFLGRKWRAFHVEPIKKAKVARGDECKYDKRVVLFATEGHGIGAPYSVGRLLDWFLPFKKNQKQSFCKAYARFDLGLSRTTPTCEFRPSQVRYVDDKLADGSPEQDCFNDPYLYFEPVEEKKVMNDGCSVMSVGAAKAIWKAYKRITGTNDPLPSAFQGRIGGAKGLWMISAETYTQDPNHLEVWIELSDSQRKFKPHDEDYFDEFFDHRRLTFELVNYSSPPVPSDLHISFIPILVDRGVPRRVVADLMVERLDAERQHLLDILPDPVKMLDWIHKQGARERDETIRWQAALPHSLDEKVRYLLETGFSPTRAPYLARCLHRYIDRQHLLKEKKLRAPLGKATYVYGVADPLGVLSPGQVHLQFSTAFIDHEADESFQNLNALDIIVARQPACRRSDMQKVRAVVHPDLSHLVDVVVFPTKGQFPLAGKLQGGDYDGDIFWLCWEPALVSPFLNAPAPIESPNPRDYSIKQDTRKLHDVMDPTDLRTVDKLLREVLVFRTSPSMLGIVTNYLEKQAYIENMVWSENLDPLSDIHDLLVDAPKQGYTFTERDFRYYVQNKLLLRATLPLPAYKAAMEACETAKDMGEAEAVRKKEFKPNPQNALDHLYFNVMRVHNVETLQMIDNVMASAEVQDKDLQYPHIRQRTDGSEVIQEELDNLQHQLKDIIGKWNRGMRNSVQSGQYNKLVDECYRQYRALMPTEKEHHDIKPWLMPYLNENFSIWESIRASTLYATFLAKEKAPFIFHMAGKELAILKAYGRPGTRAMVREIHANTKPRPIRFPTQSDEPSGATSSDDEFDDALEHPADVEASLGTYF